ncbi:MAG: hypothetical protein LBQ59_01415 [Candidatus Peribacteria bacterium]|jgi:DNA-binding response OmpR family regulator|nr:hypothetical protein [Candidatus Peribacteria bacterium]
MFRRISEEKSNIIAYKNHSFDLNTRKFLNCNFEFTKKETMIIELFLLNKNKVIPKTKISTSIW